MTLKTLVISGALAALPCALTAVPITIDFELPISTLYTAGPVVVSGFQIGNPPDDEQHFHFRDSTESTLLPDNGTFILHNDQNTEIFVRDISNNDFLLTSVDVAKDGATGITVYGYLNNVLTGTIVMPVAGQDTFVTLNGSSLGIVDRLVFDGTSGNGFFALDNLMLQTGVPDGGGTLGLLAAGVLCLAGYRRKSDSKV